MTHTIPHTDRWKTRRIDLFELEQLLAHTVDESETRETVPMAAVAPPPDGMRYPSYPRTRLRLALYLLACVLGALVGFAIASSP